MCYVASIFTYRSLLVNATNKNNRLLLKQANKPLGKAILEKEKREYLRSVGHLALSIK